MAFEEKPGFGSLFRASKTAENQPDQTGYVLAHRDIKAGEKVAIAGWEKNGRLSLRVSDWRERKQQPEQTPAADLGDEVPF